VNVQEVEALDTVKARLPEYVSLVTKLLKYEIDLIPYPSEKYSPTLKQ